MAQDITIVSAFTHNGGEGNPAAVVLDADALSEASMQAIAAQAGYSETAFVSRSQVATYRLDFFTPRRRIAHCGHATVAAFGLLEATGVLGPGTSCVLAKIEVAQCEPFAGVCLLSGIQTHRSND